MSSSNAIRGLLDKCLAFQKDLPTNLPLLRKTKLMIEFMDTHNLYSTTDLKPYRKDMSTSEISLTKATEKFNENNFLEAFKFCCQSIVEAPIDSETLAKAYAKCAEICLKFNELEDCMRNIDLAVQHGFVYENDSVRSECIKMQEEAKKKRKTVCPNMKMSFRCNKNLPSLAFCLEYVPNQGVRTNKDLKPGDIVASEEPFAWKSNIDWMCDNMDCGKMIFTLIPCDNCVRSAFCSEQCRQEAFESYHKYECLRIVHPNNVLLRLILKAMKKYDLKYLLKLATSDLNLNEMDFTAQNYEFSMLKLIFQLKSCRAEKLPPDTHIMASCLTSQTTWLAFDMGKLREMFQPTEWDVLLKLFVVLFDKTIFMTSHCGDATAQLLLSDDHSITANVQSKLKIVAIHGLLSLFNFSCKPNICMTTDTTLRTFAKVIRPIQKGDYLLTDTKYACKINYTGNL